MRVNANTTIMLSDLGVNSDNFYILKKVATNSTWEAKGYNKIIFYMECTRDFKDIETDVKNIKQATKFLKGE